MDVRTAIDLAREPALRLGPITVRPATRELVADDGAREVLEPRVMQVLVALAKAGGEILTRDDLTACCWEGRVVGEDAINRVISRLRRSAEGIGTGAFRIETITKVGYRLATGDQVQSTPREAAAHPAPIASRRGLLAAGAAAVVAAGGSAAWFLSRKPAPPAVPDPVRAYYDQGWAALYHTSPEQNSAAVGLFRQVTEQAPDYADGWGSLAYAYMQASVMNGPATRDGLRERALSAAARALKLEPHNLHADLVLLDQRESYGHWLQSERGLRAILGRHPGSGLVLENLAEILFAVGRVGEAAEASASALRMIGLSPLVYYRHIIACMSANRLEEADQTSAKGLSLFPRHFGIWFTTFYLYLYTGRAEQALALASDVAGRPPGIPVLNFDMIILVAKAALSRAKSDIDAAMDINMSSAREGAGYAENAMLFASFLGRLDEAFALARAYFFGEGFQPSLRSFSQEQANYYRSPRPYILFQLPAVPMQSDPRFDGIVERIGLKRYWAESRTVPDYLKKPA